MYAALSCHPPLGQTTTISSDRESVRFTVVIESSAGSAKTWEVALWHNFDTLDQWTSTSLQSSNEASVVSISHTVWARRETNCSKTAVKPDKADVQRQYYTIDLPGRPKHGSSLSYTITFRASEVSARRCAYNELHFVPVF